MNEASPLCPACHLPMIKFCAGEWRMAWICEPCDALRQKEFRVYNGLPVGPEPQDSRGQADKDRLSWKGH